MFQLIALARRHGIGNLLKLYFFRLLRAALGLRIIRGLALENAPPPPPGCDGRYECGFASAEDLRRYASDPDNDLSPGFVEEALARGDVAFAVTLEGRLASYAWGSRQPTRVGPAALTLHYDPRYLYAYKAFTVPAFRGRRLYNLMMARALEHFLASGFAGILAYVEATNLPSLKGLERVGYRPFGSVYVLKVLGQTFTFTSPGCRTFGFRIAVARRSFLPKRVLTPFST